MGMNRYGKQYAELVSSDRFYLPDEETRELPESRGPLSVRTDRHDFLKFFKSAQLRPLEELDALCA